MPVRRPGMPRPCVSRRCAFSREDTHVLIVVIRRSCPPRTVTADPVTPSTPVIQRPHTSASPQRPTTSKLPEMEAKSQEIAERLSQLRSQPSFLVTNYPPSEASFWNSLRSRHSNTPSNAKTTSTNSFPADIRDQPHHPQKVSCVSFSENTHCHMRRLPQNSPSVVSKQQNRRCIGPTNR